MKSPLPILLLLVTLIICGCQVSGTPAPRRLTPTAAITPTPVSTAAIRSPDGTPRAVQVCYQGLMDWRCSAVFPNGATLWGQPWRWSPDGQFALNCLGGNHDSPCIGYAVWDMVNGRVTYDGLINDVLSYMDWSPDEGHTLIYIVEGAAGRVPDEAYSLDAATGHEMVLTECPVWLDRQLGHPCGAGPGIVVGGKIIGLPSAAQAVITTYDLDDGHIERGRKTVETDVGAWQQLLRRAFGSDFEITVALQGYVSSPTSYAVHVDGSQVYQFSAGRLDLIQPAALDFVLEKQ